MVTQTACALVLEWAFPIALLCNSPSASQNEWVTAQKLRQFRAGSTKA